MKIIHFSMAGYTDGLGYQENILPKYHALLGNQVWMVSTNIVTKENNDVELTEKLSYQDGNGVNIIRIPVMHFEGLRKTIGIYYVYGILKNIKPDYIFIHDLYGVYLLQIAKYVKDNPHCILVADNHEDIYNVPRSSSNWKRSIFVNVNRWINKYMSKYYDKVYGVTEGRKEYAHEIYGVPNSILDILYMGADTNQIHFEKRAEIREHFCEKYNIPKKSFIITSGGRLGKDKFTVELVNAFLQLNKKNTVLVLFGSIKDDIKKDMEPLIKDNIYYIGFQKGENQYNTLLSADLGIFPGGHSVLWEQSVACELPCIFQYRKGMTHVDIGGNCLFIKGTGIEDILEPMNKVTSDMKIYKSMKEKAESDNKKVFLYNYIAQQSLDIKKRNSME